MRYPVKAIEGPASKAETPAQTKQKPQQYLPLGQSLRQRDVYHAGRSDPPEDQKMLVNLLLGTIMKKIVLLALSVVASAAMAAGPAGVQTTINGTSTQTASLTSTGVSNTAFGVNANAQQNLASNAGDVEIAGGGNSSQTVRSTNATFRNTANANTKAQQNVSSNSGDVTIRGRSTQLTTATAGTVVANIATGTNAKAVQSIASNASCSTCL